MNENHRLIKDVSNALTRREECFDLSGVLRPSYDLNAFKFNKLFGYSTACDETIKKILKPEIRIPRQIGKKESEEIKLREKFYHDELKYHLRWDRRRKTEATKPFAAYSINTSLQEKQQNRAKSHQVKTANVPIGLMTVRSVHTPTLSKREKLSMLNITSKIMSASEDILIMKKLANEKSKNRLTCYARKSLSQSRREDYERKHLEKSRLAEKHRLENERASRRQLMEEEDKQDHIYDKEFDSISASSTHSEEMRESAHQAALEKKRQQQLELEQANLKLKQEEEKQQLQAKQAEYVKDYEDLDEIKSGKQSKLRVIIKTSDKTGSGTDALIRLRLYGTKGKSRIYKLKESKTHRIPFRRGNTDVFDLNVHDIGKINAISIGHSEMDIEYSWLLDYVKIEDYENNHTINFEYNDWFSVKSNDGQTSRILTKKQQNVRNEIDSESFTSSGSSISISEHSTALPTPKHEEVEEEEEVQEQKPKSVQSSRSKINKTPSKQSTPNKKSSLSKRSSSSSSSSDVESIVEAKQDHQSPVIIHEEKKSTPKISRKSSSSSLSSSSSSTSISSTASSSSFTTRGSASYTGSTRKKSIEKQQEEAATEEKSSSGSSSSDSDNDAEHIDKVNSKDPLKKMSTRSLLSAKNSTSSSVREAEEEITEITSRKFNLSPSLHSSPKTSQSDFNVQATASSSTKLRMNLFETVEMNHLDALKDLIQKSPLDINKIDSSGRTLMIIACENGFEQIVKYLADNNDSLLRIDTPLGLFPVHMCALNNHLNCLNILYEYGASLQSKTNDGQTPLHLAAQCGNIEVVKWLVEHNINVNIIDNKKETAYDLAKKQHHFDIANYLAVPSGKPLIPINQDEDEETSIKHDTNMNSSGTLNKRLSIQSRTTPQEQGSIVDGRRGSKSKTSSSLSKKSKESSAMSLSKSTTGESSSLSSTSSSSDEDQITKNQRAKSSKLSTHSDKAKSLLASEKSSLTSGKSTVYQTPTASSPSLQHQQQQQQQNSNLTIRQLIETTLNKSANELKEANDSDSSSQDKNIRAKSKNDSRPASKSPSVLLEKPMRKSNVDSDSEQENTRNEETATALAVPTPKSSKHSLTNNNENLNRPSSSSSGMQYLKASSNELKASRTSMNKTPLAEENNDNDDQKSLNGSINSNRLKTPEIVNKSVTPSKSPVKSIEKLTYSRTSVQHAMSSSSDESDHETKTNNEKPAINGSSQNIDENLSKKSNNSKPQTPHLSRTSFNDINNNNHNSKPPIPQVLEQHKQSRTSFNDNNNNINSKPNTPQLVEQSKQSRTSFNNNNNNNKSKASSDSSHSSDEDEKKEETKKNLKAESRSITSSENLKKDINLKSESKKSITSNNNSNNKKTYDDLFD